QGFGFVEVGSVTPRPQSGNPRPRLFRLEKDRAVINQMGFNNQGHAAVAGRISARTSGGGIVGVNLGKNKDSSDAAADYETGATVFSPLADFLVINISSPNTPGLRALQGPEPLKELLSRTLAARDSVAPSGGHTPVLLKIAPDLTDEDKSDIADISLDAGIDGLIITNTTIERPDTLTDPSRVESGGLSGRPLFEMSTRVLSEMYVATDGKIPLVGVGGIENGRGAYEKIINGASLVELYSAMVFEGPGIVETIKQELVDCLKSDGFESIVDAIGSKHR
ncbi:MAG: quinone-dependent dihydroorotate dehydrogenase, partial [Rhodospirillaceae bacterium]|nr:quinone-dependent dihydroorotate dehydrogenase [Rhodospirillaceae bacterium]